MICGLLGEKLSHSYSPQIHRQLADYTYVLFEKSREELPNFLSNGDFSALNVTIPYKKEVIPYCSELSDCAKRLGSVNTIVRRADGTLWGHNSDFFGFSYMLKRSGVQVSGRKVLVLGSGGASVTVCAVLQEFGAKVVVISRSGENNYGNLHRHKDAVVIVNTTPVGMYPNTGVSPVDLALFPALDGVLDLIYNPSRTKLFQDAQMRGLKAVNGLWMLIAQAWESAQWFTGQLLKEELIPDIYRALEHEMKNIVLIGMPGSGKSTIGKLLAEETGKRFVDADAVIVSQAGKTIPEIFAKDGEAVFRALETDVLAQLGKQSGLIIATGGGCVTRPDNYSHLHQNSVIIWLQREISALPTEGRPLSQSGSLDVMYQHRKPLYAQFADIVIDNNGSPETTIAKIMNTEEQL